MTRCNFPLEVRGEKNVNGEFVEQNWNTISQDENDRMLFIIIIIGINY